MNGDVHAYRYALNAGFPYGPSYPVDTGEYFFPSNAPNAMQNRAEITALVHQWIVYDWVRITMGLVGLVCAVRAISVPFPSTATSPDNAPERALGRK